MAYGGDFGDMPNDYNFVMDGCVFSDHTPTPGLIEYAKAIEPVQSLSLDHDRVTILNRYDFMSLDHLTCSWDVVVDGIVITGGKVEIPRNIKPHAKAIINLEGLDAILKKLEGEEAYVKIYFQLRDAKQWAPANHQVAFGEFQLRRPQNLAALLALDPPSSTPTLEQKTHSTLSVKSSSGKSTWGFDLARGVLSSWRRDGKEIMSQPLAMDFYRALTDNDREIHGKKWIECRLHQTKHYMREVKWHDIEGGVEVQIVGRIAPPVLAWGVDVTWTFTFKGDSLHLKVKGRPRGAWLPTLFARIGITLGLSEVSTVSWWGRGPGESYCDKKLSQSFGNWTSTVDDLFVDYEFPQECSQRTDVRRVEFLSGIHDQSRALRARFGDLEGASFTAMHYTTQDLDACTHPYELHKRKRQDTIVRLDWMHHGLGTGSCGPPTMPAYQLESKDFDVEVLLD